MHARRLRLVEAEAEAPGAAEDKPLRIAIATNDLDHLNAHFGSARKVALYDVTTADARFVEALAFGDVTQQAGKHDEVDDKITPKVEALAGSALLFVLAIGGPAAAKVVRAGIHPVKVKEVEAITDVLARVQKMLRGTPPPFLRKILGRAEAKPSFMDDYAEEMAR